MTPDLPGLTELGNPGRWTFADRYGSLAELAGDFLGMGSSHRPSHKHVFPPYAAPRQHCSTCRWTEVRIFQERTDSGRPCRYLVVRTGRSTVPGEEDRVTFGWSDTAADTVSSLVAHDDEGRPSLPYVERRALATATAFDDDLDRAYEQALRGIL